MKRIKIKLIIANQTATQTQIEMHDTDMKAAMQAQMNLITANQAQTLKIEIETILADANDNKRISYFYLPQAQGGLLETVRQTVLDTINANVAAGLSVGNAQTWFARAEASLAKKDYKNAYDHLRKAYQEAVK